MHKRTYRGRAGEILDDSAWHDAIRAGDVVGHRHANAIGRELVWSRQGVDACVVEKVCAVEEHQRWVAHAFIAVGTRAGGLENNLRLRPRLAIGAAEREGERVQVRVREAAGTGAELFANRN
jgi:hypothetical protein